MSESETTAAREVEAVARAICREQHLTPDNEALGEDVPVYWMLFIPHAEAALAALKKLDYAD